MVLVTLELNKVARYGFTQKEYSAVVSHLVKQQSKLMLQAKNSVTKKSNSILQGDINIQTFVKELVDFSITNAQYDKYQIIEQVNKEVVAYYEKEYGRKLQSSTLEGLVNEYVEPYYIKKYVENDMKKEVKSLEKFKFGNSTNYVVHFDDSTYLFTDTNNPKIENFLKIPRKGALSLKKNKYGYDFLKEDSETRLISFEHSEKVKSKSALNLKLKVKDAKDKILFPEDYEHFVCDFDEVDLLGELDNQVKQILGEQAEMKNNGKKNIKEMSKC